MKNLERLHRHWAQSLDDAKKHEEAITHYQISLSWFNQMSPHTEDDKKTISTIQSRLSELFKGKHRGITHSRRSSTPGSISDTDKENGSQSSKKGSSRSPPLRSSSFSSFSSSSSESPRSDRFEEESNPFQFYAAIFLAIVLAIAAVTLFSIRLINFISDL